MITDLQDPTIRLSVSVENAGAGIPLPPASSQRFLKRRKYLPVVVLADHKNDYNNT